MGGTRKIFVCSGKGGVGKTTVAVSLAVALARRGYDVGILDGDLTGANVTDCLGAGELEVRADRFVPARSMGVKYASLAQIASEGDPVLWSGRDLESAAKQLLKRTDWGNLDFLIVDSPPGTGSEPQALLPLMDFALVVTVPSALSESNVRRVVEMCREAQVPVLGLVKNMTHFECPSCGRRTRLFPEDHGFEGIPVLAELPFRPEVARRKVIDGLDVDPFLRAMEHPVLLEKRVSARAKILKALLLASEAGKDG